MRNIRRILFLGVLPLIQIGYGQGAIAQTCQLKEMASVPITTDAAGELIMPVTINDTQLQMIVAPGAYLGVLSPKIVQTLGLETKFIPDGMRIYGGMGEKLKQYAVAPSLKLGLEHAEQVKFLIEPDTDDQPAAGMIGRDMLRSFDLDFDFGGGKLNLFSPDHCEGKVVYWAPSYTDAPLEWSFQGYIRTKMNIDGHDFDGDLDPSAGVSYMTLTEATAIFGLTASSPGMQAGTEDIGPQQVQIYRYRFKSLVISGITVTNPIFEIFPDFLGDAERKEGYVPLVFKHDYSRSVTIGMDILKHLHLYVAYKEDKIYATAADAGAATAKAQAPDKPSATDTTH